MSETARNWRTKSTQYLVGFREGVEAAVAWHHKASDDHKRCRATYAAAGDDALAAHHNNASDDHLIFAGHLRRLRRDAANEIERRCDEEDRNRARADNGQFGVGA